MSCTVSSATQQTRTAILLPTLNRIANALAKNGSQIIRARVRFATQKSCALCFERTSNLMADSLVRGATT
jgi:hypothetical protein